LVLFLWRIVTNAKGSLSNYVMLGGGEREGVYPVTERGRSLVNAYARCGKISRRTFKPQFVSLFLLLQLKRICHLHELNSSYMELKRI